MASKLCKMFKRLELIPRLATERYLYYGVLNGVPVAFLPRHGRGHRINPTELNSRANIYGFKSLGVQYLISVTAVGSLREDYAPLDIVIPDQLLLTGHVTANEQDHFF